MKSIRKTQSRLIIGISFIFICGSLFFSCKIKDSGTISLKGKPGSASALSSLSLSTSHLNETFNSEKTNYTSSLGISTQTLEVTPTAANNNATILVNGQAVVSGTASNSIPQNLGENVIHITVSAQGETTTYTLTTTRGVTAQEAYVKASNDNSGDEFGAAVAVSGDTIVIGAAGEASGATGVNGDQSDNTKSVAGAAYVFVKNGSVWQQQAYLKASNTEAGDHFGNSVAISGDTIVVGAFEEDSNATGVNGTETDNNATKSGAAYVFFRSGTTWTQQAYLKASNTGALDRFGNSVAISGNTIAVGASGEASNATGVNGTESDNSATNAGAAYVFFRSGTIWAQQAYLKASNTGGNDNFGTSISLFSDTIVVGAYGEASNATGVNGTESDDSATNAGAAYVFHYDGTAWTQQAYLKASNTGAGDIFGVSVSLSNDTIVIGAYSEDSNATGVNGDSSNDSASTSGAAYVFFRSGTTWTQQAYLKASNTEIDDQFGYGVGISGNVIIVGGYNERSSSTGINGIESDNSVPYSGAAYVFYREGTTWRQRAYLKASNTGVSDNFGQHVAVSGDLFVTGAHKEDSNTNGINGNGSDNSASDSGAAYIFK